MLNDFYAGIQNGTMPLRKSIQKKGTLAIAVVETTPVVWKGRLLRFEWARNHDWGYHPGVTRDIGCYHFIDMETGIPTDDFALDHAFGCCYAENNVMYVHGKRCGSGGNTVDVFWSADLKHWESQTALTLPADIPVYNTSVCKGADGYIMAIEIGGQNPIVGVPYTCVFAKSADLLHWELLPMTDCIYAQDRYTACPTIRYYDGFYYMVYLEGAPCHRWIPYIVRSRDLKHFELGLNNPFMWFGPEDKQLLHPEQFTPGQRLYIENAVNCNNSDVDFCTYNGRTVILYSWGNQCGKEFLALAEYDGTEQELLESYFPS